MNFVRSLAGYSVLCYILQVCMHVCMYECMHVYMYACKCIGTRMCQDIPFCATYYRYTCMHACMYVYMYVRIYACARIFSYTYIHTYIQIKYRHNANILLGNKGHIRTHIHTYILSHTHTHIQTYILSHTHTYIHT